MDNTIPEIGGKIHKIYKKHKIHNKQTKHNVTRKHHPKQHAPLIVGLVFANWCGHCQHLKPEWSKMRDTVLRHPHFKHGKIVEIEDSDPEKDAKIKQIDSTLVIQGYPTIFKKHSKNIRKPIVEYYQGNRNAEALTHWVLHGHKKTLHKKMRGGYNSRSLSSKKRRKSVKK